MVTFKTKAKVNPKVLSSTTKKWVSGGSGSSKSSFKVGTPGKSSASSNSAGKSTFGSSPAPSSSFTTSDRLLQQKIQRDTLNPTATPKVPTRTINFKTPPKTSTDTLKAIPPAWKKITVVKPVKPIVAPVKKPGIWSPTNWGQPTPYVAPKPKVKSGTYVAPKKSSGGGSNSGSSGGGPKIGTFHPDSANKAMSAPGGGKLRAKNIGTGGKVTY